MTLAESITESLDQQADQVLDLTEREMFDDAASIIEEWCTESDQSILTKYLQQATETIEDRLLYATIDETGVVAGEFWFVAEPIDNN